MGAGVVMPWAVLGADERAPTGVARSREDVRKLLVGIEREVSASPAKSFTVGADGSATLETAERRYRAGRFEVPTIGTLLERAQAMPRQGRGRVRLSLLRGVDPLTDIGTLQATAPAGTLFQVASQFNCLEAPGARVVPVHDYTGDPTQGPRASVSAFPGTFLRHYFAPRANGERFVQTDTDAIDLLRDALDPAVARVQSGYLTAAGITDPRGAAAALEQRFHDLRVGVHDDVEVVLGESWGGPVPGPPPVTIAQAFTSTIALGMYSDDDRSEELAIARRQLLRAAYLGTLLGAITLGKRAVVLTLIGGGVFANPHRDIWDAIHWAIAEAEPLADGTLDAVVNVRGEVVADRDLQQLFERGGQCVEISKDKIRIRRS